MIPCFFTLLLMTKELIVEDQFIVELFFSEPDSALEELRSKYENYCHTIAFNILGNNEDCDECVNDMLLRVWNSIPPNRPENLAAYVGKITRNLALDMLRKTKAERRGGGESQIAFEELGDILHGKNELAQMEDSKEIQEALNRFLGALSKTERGVFMRRYWMMEPVAVIASTYGMSLSKASSMLHRLRQRLKKQLEKDGINL